MKQEHLYVCSKMRMEGLEESDKKCNLEDESNTEAENEEESSAKDMECSCESADPPHSAESEERLLIKKAMLDHLATNDQVFFKNLKENEGDLEIQEKFTIAEEVLNKNYGLFLAKFGNHLLKEHLSYFENRSEEDSLIVDLHLKQIKKALERQSSSKQSNKSKPETGSGDKMEVVVQQSPAELCLRNRLLDYLSLSKDAHFKSQQVGEPDLNQCEKRDIAEEVLDRSASQFLSRFGTHLLEEHLAYFDQETGDKNYEVEYHLKRLRKTNCKEVTRVGIKNRRFEALKKMLEEGSYFSETEMRNRNPLLYEQLVGRFLTEDERRERLNNIDTTNITFVNLLLEQMDRDAVKKLRKEQEEAEDNATEDEEEEEYSFHEEMEEEDDSEEDNDLDKTLWGEECSDEKTSKQKKTTRKKEEKNLKVKEQQSDIPELSDSEKRLLMEEFRSSMFSSFLEGKDIDFDYSKVDYNADYDDLEVQGQDEEDKYFDEESSEDVSSHKHSDEEDLLDQYMSKLKPEPTTDQLAEQICTLTH